jgi:hypothetical protein
MTKSKPDLKATEYGHRKVHAIGATARRVVTGMEMGTGDGFMFVSEPGIAAAARRPNPVRDYGETDFNPEVLTKGPAGTSLKTIDDLITAGANPELAAKVKAVIGRAEPIRNIGETESFVPDGCIPDYPSSTERMGLLNTLLCSGARVVGFHSRVTLAPKFLESLDHHLTYGHIEVHMTTTARLYRESAKKLVKGMRKASKRAIKKVAKHK